jgi:hypothetical protein
MSASKQIDFGTPRSSHGGGGGGGAGDGGSDRDGGGGSEGRAGGGNGGGGGGGGDGSGGRGGGGGSDPLGDDTARHVNAADDHPRQPPAGVGHTNSKGRAPTTPRSSAPEPPGWDDDGEVRSDLNPKLSSVRCNRKL